ncbi:MAG TPA: hypothetical protein VHY84_07305 [Bryobacteraceae bacterium]|nr:hypothetical protein [Bryobacteraceae bacterium]
MSIGGEFGFCFCRSFGSQDGAAEGLEVEKLPHVLPQGGADADLADGDTAEAPGVSDEVGKQLLGGFASVDLTGRCAAAGIPTGRCAFRRGFYSR